MCFIKRDWDFVSFKWGMGSLFLNKFLGDFGLYFEKYWFVVIIELMENIILVIGSLYGLNVVLGI